MKSDFCYVYVLFSLKDKQLYIGFTTDLRQRFSQHQSGKVTSTKQRLPVSLIYYEAYKNVIDAKKREKYLKSGFGRSQLKKALATELSKLNYKYL